MLEKTSTEALIIKKGNGVGKAVDQDGKEFLLYSGSFEGWTPAQRRNAKLKVGDVIVIQQVMTGDAYPDVCVITKFELTPYARPFFRQNSRLIWSKDLFYRSRLEHSGNKYQFPSRAGSQDSMRDYARCIVEEVQSEKA